MSVVKVSAMQHSGFHNTVSPAPWPLLGNPHRRPPGTFYPVKSFLPTIGKRGLPMLGTVLIIILILLLLGAWPSWPYSRGWGYYPSGLLGLVLIVIIILVLMGRF
jgi:hypothetical protein